eukprot:m.455798 g.455798  ORF g.455798 m.455798 type:complete len:103 (-) comp56968_c0_seq1:140-448(-)
MESFLDLPVFERFPLLEGSLAESRFTPPFFIPVTLLTQRSSSRFLTKFAHLSHEPTFASWHLKPQRRTRKDQSNQKQTMVFLVSPHCAWRAREQAGILPRTP